MVEYVFVAGSSNPAPPQNPSSARTAMPDETAGSGTKGAAVAPPAGGTTGARTSRPAAASLTPSTRRRAESPLDSPEVGRPLLQDHADRLQQVRRLARPARPACRKRAWRFAA